MVPEPDNTERDRPRTDARFSYGVQTGPGGIQINNHHRLGFGGNSGEPYNSAAVTTLVFAVAGFLLLPLPLGVGALVMGPRAMRQIAVTGERGARLTRVSIIVSRITVGFSATVATVVITAFTVMALGE